MDPSAGVPAWPELEALFHETLARAPAERDMITLWINPDMEHTIWPGDDDRVQQIPFLAPAAAISTLKVSGRPIAEQRGKEGPKRLRYPSPEA